MRRLQRRAYLVTLIVLLCLAGLAYYAQKQAEYFQIKTDDRQFNPADLRQKKAAPPQDNSQQQSQAPAATEENAQSSTEEAQESAAPKPKVESYIIDVTQYEASLYFIQVKKGSEVRIVLKSDQYRSGSGLEFRTEFTNPLVVRPGETRTFAFMADSSFALDGYLAGTNTKLPYSIGILVKE